MTTEIKAKTYHISCHCQSHILAWTTDAESAFTGNGVCDCSHCLKRRIVWIFALKGTLEVVKGVGKDGVDLKGYTFGPKQVEHQFCGQCGTHLLGSKFDKDGNTMFNARAIREPDFVLWDHPLKLYSGLDRLPQYTHTTLADLPGAKEHIDKRAQQLEHPTEIRVGSCHCQAIRFAVACRPLEKVKLSDCSCSMCAGNGVLWIYPSRKDTYFHPHPSGEEYQPPSDLVIDYGFGKKGNLHYMCKTCGCQVYEYRALTDGKEDGSNGDFGLNVALFSDAIDYLGDVQGLKEVEGHKGKRLEGLKKVDEDRTREPLYQLKL